MEGFGTEVLFSSPLLQPPLAWPLTWHNVLSSGFILAGPLILIEKLLLEIVGLLHTAC